MKLAGISFSKAGRQLAEKLLGLASDDLTLFDQSDYKQHLKTIFSDYEGVVFFSSTGIAVRLSAPYINDKTVDPAIVVVDDMGKHAISLLSGHLGGANKLTLEIAELLGCRPVITTASDNRGFEAVDLFAQSHHLQIEDMMAAKSITAMMVDEQKIGFRSEITGAIDYPHLSDDKPAGWIVVDHKEQVSCDRPCCILRPKILHIGIGCRKGKRKEEILKAVKEVFVDNNLSLKAIRSIATIELKKREAGIIEASQDLKCDLKIFSAEQIKPVQNHFEHSAWVEEQTSVGSVCEPCAFLAGDEIIVPKTIKDGITIAVSKSNQLK